MSKTICTGTDQPVTFRPGEVHARCAICGKDLSGWGKGKHVTGRTEDGRYKLVAKRHYV